MRTVVLVAIQTCVVAGLYLGLLFLHAVAGLAVADLALLPTRLDLFVILAALGAVGSSIGAAILNTWRRALFGTLPLATLVYVLGATRETRLVAVAWGVIFAINAIKGTYLVEELTSPRAGDDPARLRLEKLTALLIVLEAAIVYSITK